MWRQDHTSRLLPVDLPEVRLHRLPDVVMAQVAAVGAVMALPLRDAGREVDAVVAAAHLPRRLVQRCPRIAGSLQR